MQEYQILTATAGDVQEIVVLANDAYRGKHSKKGWTTEAHLIEGDRMNVHTLVQMMAKPGVVIRKCITLDHVIVGCVYLEAQSIQLYLGLLTVSPAIQATGIGKMLLRDAEEIAVQEGIPTIVIDVLSVRRELIDWYIRRGFYLTGKTMSFPVEKKLGSPLQPLELVELKKYVGRGGIDQKVLGEFTRLK
jgi:predicted N-acetyltransferase YhbS